MTPQRRAVFKRIEIGGALAEFDGLEVRDRALVLRFSCDFVYDVKYQGFDWLG